MSAEQPDKETGKAEEATGSYSGLAAYVTRRMPWLKN